MDWEQWQWKITLHSPKLQHRWNLTIRLFSVISRTLIGGEFLLLQSVYSTAPADRAIWIRVYLGVIAKKGYSTFPQSPGREPHHQMQFSVIPRLLIGLGWEVLPLFRGAVGVFYSHPPASWAILMRLRQIIDQKTRGNTLFCWFLQDIWSHTQRRDGEKIEVTLAESAT